MADIIFFVVKSVETFIINVEAEHIVGHDCIKIPRYVSVNVRSHLFVTES